MTTRLRARTLPYRPRLRSFQRVCPRCGIHYTINPTRKTQDQHCRDCRAVERTT